MQLFIILISLPCFPLKACVSALLGWSLEGCSIRISFFSLLATHTDHVVELVDTVEQRLNVALGRLGL